MIEGLISGLVVAAVVLLVSIMVIRSQLKGYATDFLDNYISDYVHSEDFKTEVNEFVGAIRVNILSGIGGIQSGVSRQMKGLEKELIAEGIDKAVGLPVGGIAMKYMDKYPFLKSLIPLVGSGGQPAQSQPTILDELPTRG